MRAGLRPPDGTDRSSTSRATSTTATVVRQRAGGSPLKDHIAADTVIEGLAQDARTYPCIVPKLEAAVMARIARNGRSPTRNPSDPRSR